MGLIRQGVLKSGGKSIESKVPTREDGSIRDILTTESSIHDLELPSECILEFDDRSHRVEVTDILTVLAESGDIAGYRLVFQLIN